ncbi:hypothetical protein OZX58_03375 [Lactobacillus sp. ESL0680]|uniref:hypothetical protein n=1 Tax=Lactobacillus sp. ESL0680 TaxID=2983210 RepID=UPI0023F83E1A|nr:hypothetical protein [Lactobacillus sp. ESL0680]WEV39291.1 hypothetical protein OZX58_03375 [Lactobacillus sp. ESL0680]
MIFNGKRYSHFYLNGYKFEYSLKDIIGQVITVKTDTQVYDEFGHKTAIANNNQIVRVVNYLENKDVRLIYAWVFTTNQKSEYCYLKPEDILFGNQLDALSKNGGVKPLAINLLRHLFSMEVVPC